MCYKQKGSDSQMDNGVTRHRHGVANLYRQLIGIWVQGFRLLNMYAPPGQQTVGVQFFAECISSFRMGRNWAIMRDFNEIPIEDCTARIATRGGLLWPGHRGQGSAEAAVCSRSCQKSSALACDLETKKFPEHSGPVTRRVGLVLPAAPLWPKL